MYQFVSPTLETELLSHIVHSQSFLERCVEVLPYDRLGSKVLKHVYYEVIEFYKKWGKLPDKTSIRQKFKDTLPDEEYQNVKQFLNNIWDTTYPSVPEATLTEVLGKYKARKLAIAVKKIGDLLREGRTAECDGLLANYNEITSGLGSSENFKLSEVSESVDGVLAEIKEDRDNPKEFKGVPTGIAGIDGVIKGLLPEEFGLVVGKTGGYKSTLMINMAAHAFISGRNVLFFVIESPPKQYMLNIYSLLCGVNAEKLHELSFDDRELDIIEKKMKLMSKISGGKLIFVDAPQGLTPTVLQNKIREAKRKHKIDIAFVDYMGIMELEGASRIDYYDWKPIATLSRLIKAICRAEHIPLWSAAQQIGDKKGAKEEKEEHDSGDIAFAKAVSHNCDVIVKVVQDQQEALMGQMRMYFLKIRRKKKPDSPSIFEAKMEFMRMDNPSTMKLLESLRQNENK